MDRKAFDRFWNRDESYKERANKKLVWVGEMDIDYDAPLEREFDAIMED